MLKSLLAVFASGALLLSGGAAAADDLPTTGQPSVIGDTATLRALFADRTLYGSYGSGDKFKEYYSPDGRSAYWQMECLHSGHWWVARLDHPFGPFQAGTPIACFSYATLNKPDQPSCFVVGGPGGRELFYMLDGLPSRAGIPGALVDHWVPGNPEKLPLDEDNCPSS